LAWRCNHKLVAAEERSEAAFGVVLHSDAVAAEPECKFCLTHRAIRLYDGYAAERSLATLVSGYKCRAV